MEVYNPVSTYRLQFHKGFTLAHAEKIVGYLHRLGIKTIYASPVFQAVKGSTHGYDVANPLKLNPEIGTEGFFEKIIERLHRKSMGWLQDIVPNHMAFSPENPWIADVLEKGKKSEFYHFFDILPAHANKNLNGKLMLPFFGKPLDKLVEDGELTVRFNENGFQLVYFESEFPVSAKAYPVLLQMASGLKVPKIVSDFISAKNLEDWDKQKQKLFAAYQKYKGTKAYIDQCLSVVNGEQDQMKAVVDELEYLPAFWKDTEHQINYRRFFTINGLICLNIQDEKVFQAYHGLIKKWVDQKLINGLRVDHIDGLYHPGEYLQKLRQLVGEKVYISVEKILEKDEKLAEWPVEGSTGYDFNGLINNLLTNPEKGKVFYSYYKEWVDNTDDFEDVFYKKNRFILYARFQGELENLTRECLLLPSVANQGLSETGIKTALAEFLVFCPVYKIYGSPSSFSKKEKKMLGEIFEKALKKNAADANMLHLLKGLFFLKNLDEAEIDKVDTFFRHCMQFTGPLMAKGIEDTAFYSYNPFICHNEVGDSPGYFGIKTKTFHRYMEERQRKFPLTMNTTSTHDTKRGEDARARLNVLSDLPEKWMEATSEWRKINRQFKQIHDGKEIPTPNDEYFIYQVLVAHLPMDGKISDSFIERLQEYLVKAMREAKVNSSWSNPNEDYEELTLAFVRQILSDDSGFPEKFLPFMNEVIPHGIVNSITQLILKNMAPGVPDTYQGCENWNLSFVDPDNRRPVDYEKLSVSLDEMLEDARQDVEYFAENLWEEAGNGKVKNWLTYLTLQERRMNEDLFLKGNYVPLKVKGKFKKHIIAFYRRYRDKHLLVVLPLNTANLPVDHNWENTRVQLPEFAAQEWENLLTGKRMGAIDCLKINKMFASAPFAILRGKPFQPARRAGILMHISSLPGKYGIGDFGPEARKFVDFLQRTGQRYWQVLPLNISNHSTGYSPYSSFSAFAGNVLYIDPGYLVEQGLLDKSELAPFSMKNGEKVDYPHAENAKYFLLDKAFSSFKNINDSNLAGRYETFLKKEKYWLDDFCLFVVLKGHFDHKPWNEWPEEFRERDLKALGNFSEENKAEIELVQFRQFIFDEQWNRLKTYANDRGVQIFGDVPIYVSYDSVDVWSNRGLFRLNKDLSMEAVAGVPPDYFNANGQLWGMPLFDWEAMEQDGYLWWLKRLRKNLEWFDLLRLDHFRGFSAFWEVPAGEETAINGQWVKGPATKIFDVIKEAFPRMPFVAEDLGQIDQDVYDLRDQYDLPGMKVVQFGFGEKMPFLQHVPNNHSYNSIVYTGTHDNNTLKGWYRKEADKATLKRYEEYTGNQLKGKNCHLEMVRLAYASVAKMAIIPMQDWLGLDENSRMNFPSTTEGNWLWRMMPEQMIFKLEKKIKKMVKTFGRH